MADDAHPAPPAPGSAPPKREPKDAVPVVRSKRMKEAGYEEYIFMPLLMRPRQGVA